MESLEEQSRHLNDIDVMKNKNIILGMITSTNYNEKSAI